MVLSLVFEITISLIFIYLALSILASEIQELITTLLQWRALHLKRAIEVLIAGGSEGTEEKEYTHTIELVNQLYKHPLINNLNQEARGIVPRFFRHITWLVNKPFGAISEKRQTGPSYIPSETFAATLLETLEIPTLVQKETGLRLETFKDEQLESIKKVFSTTLKNIDTTNYSFLEKELKNLEESFQKNIKEKFSNGEASLPVILNMMEEDLEKFIAICLVYLPEEEYSNDKFIEWITSLKKNVFDISKKHSVLLKRLQPSLTEVLKIIQDKDSETYKAVAKQIDNLPKSITDSLEVLANRAQAKLQSTEQDLNQLRQEVEVWFDRSMERASGVYKRNAKGVALLIGFLLALVVNADTFHIVSRLAADSNLRIALAENAEIVTANCPSSKAPAETGSQLECIRSQIDNSIPIPFGWGTVNLKQQQNGSLNWFYPPLRRFLGWIVTGLAISMGAGFWFDLLGKVINVRNAGRPPEKSTSSSESVSN